MKLLTGELMRIANSHKAERRLVRRTRIALGCMEGKQIIDIAAELGEQPDVIIKWRDRFVENGIAGLNDAPRSAILDNYCIHKRCDEWLAAHPNVFFHYTRRRHLGSIKCIS